MVLIENWPLSIFFFLGNAGQKNVFYDITERKNVFLGYKNNTLFIQAIWAREMCFMIF